MKIVIRALKYLFCAYGGAVTTSFIFLLLSELSFSRVEMSKHLLFLEAMNPIVGTIGALLGVYLVFRHERNAFNGKSD